MAKRGGKRHLKRIATPPAVPIHNKKEGTFILKPIPGPHGKEMGYAVAVLLRDVLGLVKTLKEASFALRQGFVKVNGKVVKEPRFPVGLMDVVEIVPMGKVYIIAVDEKGRLSPREVEKADKTILQIKEKHTVRGAKEQITFHNGWTMLSSDAHLKVQDAVVFNIKEKKIEKHLPLQKGARVLVVRGRSAGLVGEVVELPEEKKGVAVISANDREYRVRRDYLLPISEEVLP